MANTGLSVWTNVNDGQNNETLRVEIDTRTGQVVTFLIRDKETSDVLARLHIPEDACNVIGQALMLASTLKAGEG